MNWTVKIRALGLAALIITSSAPADDLHDRLAPDDADQIHTIHSAKRRIAIVGRNRVDMMRAGRLAEDALDRIDRTLRHEAAFGERSGLRIALDRDPSRSGSVTHFQRLVGKRLQQGIRITNPDQVATDDVLNALAWVVVSRHVLTGVRSGAVDPEGVLPRWLTEGLGQSLYRDIRARNYDRILLRRSKGRVRKLVELVAPKTVVKDHADRRPAYGMIMAWILSFEGVEANIESLFNEIAAGRAPGLPWFIEHVPASENAEDVERAWDTWLARQNRVIFSPGTLPASVLKTFRAEQVLRRGKHGIPGDADLPATLELKHLIGMRSEPWLGLLVRDRVAAFRSLAIARGDEFKTAVELYVDYLEALKGRAPDVMLARMLGHADEALKELEKRTRAQ